MYLYSNNDEGSAQLATCSLGAPGKLKESVILFDI